MAKRLIVNADDFGRTSGVVEGILRAHREGIVTSTTAMMNYPSTARALVRACQECPHLGLGVHLVFTSGRPLMPVEWISSLVDERGYFLSQEAIFANPQRIDLGELKSELEAQIKTFQNATGHLPDHLDVHHFVHLLPRFFEVYLDLAIEFGLPVRIPFPSVGKAMPSGLAFLPADMMDGILADDRVLLQAKTVRGPEYFIPSFYGEEALRLNYLLSLLQSLPDGTSELMTHPGLADETLRAQSAYAAQRERELELLCHPAVHQAIAALGIELVTFASL